MPDQPDVNADVELIALAVRRTEARQGLLRGILVIWEGPDGLAHEDLLAPAGYFPAMVRAPSPERRSVIVPVEASAQGTGPNQPDGTVPVGRDPPGRTLTPIEQGILEVLATAERPLKQVAIARRMGRACNPHFKSCCGRLRREGLLIYVEPREGYWRADRELPRQAS